jgi:sugar transferase (PEP-CTERM/EpsH1 system associated)
LKILYFCPQRIWPLTGGALLRNFHLANALAARCSVTLLQLSKREEGTSQAWPDTNFHRVLTFERDSAYTVGKILRGITGPLPLTVLNYASDSASAALSSLLAEESFDAVQLESVHLLSYLDVIRHAPNRPAVVADWHNVESELMARFASQTHNWAKRLVAHRTSQLLEQAEQRLLTDADVHLVVSERESKLLGNRAPGAEVHVVPNGVDTTAFNKTAAERFAADNPARNAVLYVGSMDYHANIDAVIWFLREVWPSVANRFPRLTFTIVGRNPGPSVRALASQNVQVTGSVDDVRPYYSSAAAVVVPLRVGSGTRLKILEAMAAGVPVVSTTLGAEGLDATAGLELLIGDTPDQISSALVRLLENPALGMALAGGGQALVARNYDWSLIGKRLYDIHHDVYVRTHSLGRG